MRTASYLIAVVLGLALTLGAVPAQAETVNCTPITAVPSVITVQGIHCLTSDLSTNMTGGNAIEIQTNNVVLDLNGHKLGGLAAGKDTLAYGIFASNRQNITIKNGSVRGFYIGIYLTDSGASQGHVIEDIRADQNTASGIRVDGRGNTIRDNQVVATGGSTLLGGLQAFGIIAVGAGPQVLNNDVTDTKGGGGQASWGILFSPASDGLAVNNRITNADVGIEYDPANNSTGKYRDNLTTGVTTPFSGGTAVGVND